MAQNREISEQKILETLEAHGCSWRDYFLFGERASACICRFVTGSGIMALIIEDDDLARACKDFLRGKGAEQLLTNEDVKRRYGGDGNFRMPKSHETGS